VLDDKVGKGLQLTDSRIFSDTAYEACGMLILLKLANWKEQAKCRHKMNIKQRKTFLVMCPKSNNKVKEILLKIYEKQIFFNIAVT
jgi:hypothetical protein